MKKLIIIGTLVGFSVGVSAAQACPTMSGHYTCAVSTSELSPTFNLDIATTAEGVVSVDSTNTHFEMVRH